MLQSASEQQFIGICSISFNHYSLRCNQSAMGALAEPRFDQSCGYKPREFYTSLYQMHI